MNNTLRKILHTAAVLAITAVLLCGCGSDAKKEITSAAQLNSPEYTLGMGSGSAAQLKAEDVFPNAKKLYFQNETLGYEAVQQRKIDAYIYEKLFMNVAIDNGFSNVKVLDDTIGENVEIAVGISPVTKIPDLKGRVNSFIAEIKTDGTLDDMLKRWVAEKDYQMPDIAAPSDPDTAIVVATSGVMEPFSFYTGSSLTGFDIELARRFAVYMNADIEFKVYDYDAIIAAAAGGDCDCIMAELNVTPERAESIAFSDTLLTLETGIMVYSSDASYVPEYTEYENLSGKRVSMLNGAPFEELVSSKVADVGEFSYYNNMTDMIIALRSGKTDAFLINNAIAELAVNREKDLALFSKNLKDGVFGIAFDKNSEELEAWQRAFKTISEEEKLAAWEKWTGADESVKKLPKQDWPGLNGTVRCAACDTLEPMSYAGEGGEIIGFDIEMILMMARELDVHVEFIGMEFSSVLAYVQSGKALLGAGSIIVTDERKQSVDFVEYYPAAFVLVVRAVQEAGEADEKGFIVSIGESFNKTFIREGRWRLFISGIGTTLLITVLSVIFGTLLGFGVYMLCRRGNIAVNKVTRFCIWLVNGMPVVVLLMILYYVIFGRVAIPGTAVAVVGFTLLFGSAVYEMVRAGVATVDRGQFEAAYSLGFSDLRGFFKIILPQALPHIMPVYKGQISTLIKATAVVGYIAVHDLTKMGDIVRSRTYEAFFPLIAVAVIYFILAAVLTALVNRIEISFDAKKRRYIPLLKGVKTDD